MIDFHCHLLPQMDDGSSSADESLRMLKDLYGQGVTTVFATPHFIANEESVSQFLEKRRNAFEKIEALLDDEMPEIISGAEVAFYNGISRLDGLKSLCAENTDILLLEMPNEKWTKYTTDELFGLASDGSVRIMLAHIERCLFMQDTSVIERLIENEVVMQSNASYFTSLFTRRKACRQLSEGVIHVLGSDSHNMTSRPPKISEAVTAIRKRSGDEAIKNIDMLSRDLIKKRK